MMRYEFEIGGPYIKRAIFRNVPPDVFCATFFAETAAKADEAFRKIEIYRMSAEAEGEFSGWFTMSHDGTRLTFAGNISNLLLLLRQRTVLPQSFFAVMDQHMEFIHWLEGSTACQDKMTAHIAGLVEEVDTIADSLPDQTERDYFSSRLLATITALCEKEQQMIERSPGVAPRR